MTKAEREKSIKEIQDKFTHEEQSAQEKIRTPKSERYPIPESPIKLPPFVPGAVSNREFVKGPTREEWEDIFQRDNIEESSRIIITLQPEDKELVERYKALAERITRQVLAQLGA